MSMRLLLGSTSPYRRGLLERLRVPFDVARPDVDETPLAGEDPRALAWRLALAKATAVARGAADACVIGSDQVAALGADAIGKAGGRDAAIAQLVAMSGREVRFFTALCVLAPGHPAQAHVDTTRVRFRAFDAGTAARYVDAESPYDCAGSFKCEGLGIALFDAIETSDPTALVGLPLIATARMLRGVGFSIP